MTRHTALRSEDGWVVHRTYGVGQVEGKETKSISGEPADYYRIRMKNGSVWVPIEDFTEEHFRPLASEYEFKEALDVLKQPPRPMASHFKSRKKRINEVASTNSLLDVARLVRDLSGRRAQRSLSNTEGQALRRFTERLLVEWSKCRDIEIDDARQRLRALLRRSEVAQLAAD